MSGASYGCRVLTLVPLLHLAAATAPLIVADLRTLRLPDRIVLPGLAVLAWAIVSLAVCGAPETALRGLGGAACGGVALGVAWALGAVGLGDVKLALWLGGLAGLFSSPAGATGTPALGAAVAVGMTGTPAIAAAVVAGVIAVAATAVLWRPLPRLSALQGCHLHPSSSPLLAHLPGGGVPFGPALLAAFWAWVLVGALS
ncbi:A24 family peptidase [Herbiconiux moechotypicola]|uniref:Prepilin type IV endopeptidase peptidase domain-containing protein n=1 Tax=Herbiconiux moechotypicola TaxID=637393 RepID=A0ABN3DMF1_9MICO|nr:A24 family peptidase [Herbiconiux moechotypicola]MCS5730264.1 A24 family peptidase [Herbiconiux moechotypicola]